MIKQKNLKTDILDRGWKILSEKGRESLRLRDLAKESGCSVGTIYNLFHNLDEIVLRLNIRSLDIMYSSLHKELNHEGSLEEVLNKLGKAYVQFGMKNPLIWKSLFENLAIVPFPQWYREKVDGGIEVIEKTLEKTYGLDAKKAHRIVSFFWAAIHGMTSTMLNKKMEEVDEAYLNSYIDHCVRGIVG